MMSDEFLDERALENRRTTWRQRLLMPRDNQLVSVAFGGTTLVGFICAFADDDRDWGSYIDNLHVAATMHGRGIGRALMRDIAERLNRVQPERGVFLFVMEANAPARGFYERLGAANAGTVELTDPDGGRAPNCRYVWSRPRVLLGK